MVNSLIRIIAIYALRITIRFLHVFPIKKGRIIFNSYRGKDYSCNPKYISEYIEKNNNGKFEIIWAFNNPTKYYFLKKRGIKIVKFSSLKRIFYEATAQFSINNVGSFSWIPLRKGQEHINTWHGGGCYKRVSLGEKNKDRLFKKSLIMTAKETTKFITSSKFFRDKIVTDDFGYYGETLDIGMPRNDILFKDTSVIKNKLCNNLNIDQDCFNVLYAPTWRYDKDFEIIFPDINAIKSAVAKTYNKKCNVLFRAHANLKSNTDQEVIDVSEYPDMQELLVFSDMLITDYSSCMWDFSLTLKPCILFVPDVKEYELNRGFVVDINEWGFPVCHDNIELIQVILSYSKKDFESGINKHHKQLYSFENGTACKAVFDYLNSKINL